MKNIFLFLIMAFNCFSAKAQVVGFNDESKSDNSFYLTITEFSKLKPGDDWKKFFADSIYYVQVGDQQVWVKPQELQKLIAPQGNETDLLKFFQHHFKYGFRSVTDSSADNEDRVFGNELSGRKTFRTYPFINDSLIRNGECNCVVLKDAPVYEQQGINSKIITTLKRGCCYIDSREYLTSAANPFIAWWKIDINQTTGYILSDFIVPNNDYLTRIYWTLQNGSWKISIIYLPAGC